MATVVFAMVCCQHRAFCHDAESDGLCVIHDEPAMKIVRHGQTLLEYRYTDVPKKPYVKRWVTAAGIDVLRDAPHDHLHHHALMFAVGVDGVDFWSENDRCGRQMHRAISALVPQPTGQRRWAGFEHQIDWMAPGADRPLMEEKRTIKLSAPAGSGVRLLAWSARLAPAAGRPSVTLGGSHYFGLGMRLVESMDQGGRHFNASGAAGQVVRGQERLVRTGWCAYSAKADGKPVTVALFDHAENVRHPATMFTMAQPFAYLSATLNLWKEPLVVRAEEPLFLRYGAALWGSEPDAAEIEATFQAWIADHHLSRHG